MSEEAPLLVLGRYAICDVIGTGGMATVHLGRLLGPVGFSRTVAVKRMHPHLASDPEFVTMFLDEARLAARVQHANVVSTLDVVSEGKELVLVMEYVAGESLARMLRAMQRKGTRLPAPVIGAVFSQTLYGLHAVHETLGDDGHPLGLVHRDVSPDNILIGKDGSSRLLDFGIAKATERGRRTQAGKIKGKVSYMAPEQAKGEPLDRRVDIFAASTMLWEAIVGRRLFDEETDVQTFQKILTTKVAPPSSVASGVPAGADELVLRGLSHKREGRFSTAREMAMAVEKVFGVASPAAVAQLVEGMLGDELKRKARLVDDVVRRTAEISSSDLREAGASILAKSPRFSTAAETRPFEPLQSPGAGPTRRSSADSAPAIGGTDVLDLPNLEIPGLELDTKPKPPAPATASATMLSAGSSETPAPRPAASPQAPTLQGAPEAADGSISFVVDGLLPAAPPPKPLPVQGAGGAAGPPVAADGLGSLEVDRAKNRPQRPPAPMDFRIDPKREAVYEPRALKPLLLPILLIVLVLGVGGAYLAMKRPPPPGVPSAKPATVAVADPAACEALRRRVRSGGQALGLSREGWVAELWLRARPGRTIDDKAIDLLALQGSDPASRSEVTKLSSKRRPTDEGVVIRLAGPVVAQAFDLEGAGRLSKAADLAFENTKAEAGGLYLKCAHLEVHDVGLWFRGRDLPTAGASLLFAIGSFSDVAVIREDALYPPGVPPKATVFEDLSDRVQRGKTADLQPELERYGATVAPDGKGGIRITFPVDNGGSAMRGSRVVADIAGIEAR
jgi:eukaryotic-like serine/threonine-protein kinase